MFCWIGFTESDADGSPSCGSQMRLRWQSQDTNVCHLPWATPGPTGMTEICHLFEKPISALSGGIFSAEYSRSLMCSPMSSLSGKTPANNRFLGEGLWGDNPFSSSANILWILLKSSYCNTPSNSSTKVVWRTSSHFPESLSPSYATISHVLMN